MKNFAPFADDSTCIETHGITIENHFDKVSIYGFTDVDITKDKKGLALAKTLAENAGKALAEEDSSRVKAFRDAINIIIAELEKTELVEEIAPADNIAIEENPF